MSLCRLSVVQRRDDWSGGRRSIGCDHRGHAGQFGRYGARISPDATSARLMLLRRNFPIACSPADVPLWLSMEFWSTSRLGGRRNWRIVPSSHHAGSFLGLLRSYPSITKVYSSESQCSCRCLSGRLSSTSSRSKSNGSARRSSSPRLDLSAYSESSGESAAFSVRDRANTECTGRLSREHSTPARSRSSQLRRSCSSSSSISPSTSPSPSLSLPLLA